eukprot:TRINITY_DN2130_c0_g2_i1.p2 TRINITY_DN2130_c0_g2~~TRINITY_DN2130_c0_g2_i1.p2  ORF type:complete len:100 (-),score=11.25 TRINITY_DN2130_c0_g2_i1:440-739(-)
MIVSISSPQNSRRIDTQEAAISPDLEITTAGVEDFPWKHLEFLSFQIAHMVVKKEARHSSLFLREPNTNFHALKRFEWMKEEPRTDQTTGLENSKFHSP